MSSFELEVETPKIPEQLKRLEQADKIFVEVSKPAMQFTVLTVGSLARQRWPVGVSGRSRNSIFSKVQTLATEVVGRVGSTLKEVYPSVIEFGRRKGKRPPSSALERWVYLVMGVPKDRARSVAYVVARAIGRKGIKGKKIIRGAFADRQQRIRRRWEQAAERIVERLSINGGQ
jgi:hypothetical protein